MANGEGEGEDFSDAANSIIDSFSQLQESVQNHAEKLNQLQDDAGDTLFDSNFMMSLDDSLTSISDGVEDHLDNQESLLNSFDRLEETLGELVKRVDSMEVGAGTTGGGGMNYEKVQEAVEEGVSSGFESGQISVGGSVLGEISDRITSLVEFMTGNFPQGELESGINPQNLAQIMQGELEGEALVEALNAAQNVSQEDIEKKKTGETGQNTSQMMTGFTALENFPEMLSESNAELSEFMEKVKLSQEELNELDVNLEDLTESGKEFQEISLADLLGEEMVEGTQAYQKVSRKLFENFKEMIHASGTDLLNQLTNITNESKKKLRDVGAGGAFDQNLFGMEAFFKRTDEMAGQARDDFLSAQNEIQKAFSEDLISENQMAAMSEALSGTMGTALEKFKDIDEESLSIVELNSKLREIREDITDEHSELRENAPAFAALQDRILGSLTDQLQATEEMRRRNEMLSDLYGEHYETAKLIKSTWDNAGDMLSNIAGMMKTWDFWKWFALGAVVSAFSSIYSYIFRINDSMADVADQTGMVRDQLQGVRDRAMATMHAVRSMGISMQEHFENFGRIAQQLGGMQVAADRFGKSIGGVAEDIGAIQGGFNVSGERATEMLSTMATIGDQADRTAKQMAGITQSVAKQVGMAPQQIFTDVAEASGELAKFTDKTALGMAKAASRARMMGTDLSSVMETAKQFRDDITGSIQQLQRAEIMSGQAGAIDSQALVRASFEGPEAMTEQLRKTVGELNLDFESLSPYRLEAIAEGLGMSVQKLRKMNQRIERSNKSFSELADMGVDAVNKRLEDSQTSWNKLMNTLSGIGDLLLNTIAIPIMDVVTPAVEFLANKIAAFLQEVDLENIGFAAFFDKLSSNLTEAGEKADGVKAKSASLATGFIEAAEMLYTGAKNLWPVMKQTWDVISSVATVIGDLYDAITFVVDPLISLIETMPGESTLEYWLKASIYIGAFGGALYYLNKAISSLGTSTSIMKSVALQLAALAGALYIASEAVENFAELSLLEIGKGMVGLAGSAVIMGIAMKSLSGMMTGINWPAMAGAAGLMISFAGAMWILSEAMLGFAEAGTKGLAIMAAASAWITALAAALSFIVSTGVGGAAATAAAGLMGAFAGSLWILSRAMLNFGQASHSILDAVDRIKKLENLDSIAAKVKKLTTALSDMPTAGFGDFFAGLVGEGVGDQLGMIVELAHAADPLNRVAASMERIAASVERIAAANVGDKIAQLNDLHSTSIAEGTGSAIKSAGGAIASWFESDQNVQAEGQVSNPTVQSAQAMADTETQETTTGQTERESVKSILKDIRSKESALLSSLRAGEIRVYMDGEDVTDKVSATANKRNQRN